MIIKGRATGVRGSYDDVDVLLDSLGRRELVRSTDPALRLLSALIEDVDSQWLSSVSITPST